MLEHRPATTTIDPQQNPIFLNFTKKCLFRLHRLLLSRSTKLKQAQHLSTLCNQLPYDFPPCSILKSRGRTTGHKQGTRTFSEKRNRKICYPIRFTTVRTQKFLVNIIIPCSHPIEPSSPRLQKTTTFENSIILFFEISPNTVNRKSVTQNVTQRPQRVKHPLYTDDERIARNRKPHP